MRDQIDPTFVGAAGAAYRAEMQLEDPSFYNGIHVWAGLKNKIKNIMISNGRWVERCTGNGALIDSGLNRDELLW